MTFGWPHLCDGAWCWGWGPGMELGVFLCVVCSPMCFPITEWQLWKWGRHGTGRKEEQTEQPKNILLEGESRCCWAPTSLPAPASAPKESVVSKQWSQGSWWQERLRLKSYRHRWGWRLIDHLHFAINGEGRHTMMPPLHVLVIYFKKFNLETQSKFPTDSNYFLLYLSLCRQVHSGILLEGRGGEGFLLGC